MIMKILILLKHQILYIIDNYYSFYLNLFWFAYNLNAHGVL
jgi:hypothetical protein